jgi:Rps23 Pro-64 3,4-dihydroxylase Tpa1-like proline 4-hydroxylase
MIDNPLSYILIKPNVINEYGLREIREHIERTNKTDLSVFDPFKSNQTGGKEWIVNKEVINPFYGIEITESEVPQILSYSIGGHYTPHIDGESLWQAPDGEVIWKKSTDRDISIVLYLNDDFEGGDFVFPDHHIRVRPEPGMLVCFPSNHHYKHGVEPVIRGNRYSIVCWATARGFPTMDEINRDLSQKYGILVDN